MVAEAEAAPTRGYASAREETYPSVVMVTMVYQKAAGMLWKVVLGTFFSA